MLYKLPDGKTVSVTKGKVWGNCVQLIERTPMPGKPREWVVIDPILIEEVDDVQTDIRPSV